MQIDKINTNLILKNYQFVIQTIYDNNNLSILDITIDQFIDRLNTDYQIVKKSSCKEIDYQIGEQYIYLLNNLPCIFLGCTIFSKEEKDKIRLYSPFNIQLTINSIFFWFYLKSKFNLQNDYINLNFTHLSLINKCN